MFQWEDRFSVNVKEIDVQHKKLFAIGEKIYDLSVAKDEYDHYDELMAILDELKNYAEYHFGYEESLLAKNGYAGLENQHFEHMFFIKRLERIGKKDIDGHQNETIAEISAFLVDWISSHILGSDMKYKLFLNEKGIY